MDAERGVEHRGYPVAVLINSRCIAKVQAGTAVWSAWYLGLFGSAAHLAGAVDVLVPAVKAANVEVNVRNTLSLAFLPLLCAGSGKR